MRSTLTLSALLLCAFLGQAQQINNVIISPSVISVCTVMDLTVIGVLPASAQPQSFSPSVTGQTLTVTYSATGGGGGNVPFNVSLEGLGPWGLGEWTLVVNLVYNGNTVDTYTTNFTVVPGFNPDAGEEGDTAVCNTGASFPLLSVLNGTPDDGGDWAFQDGTPVNNGLFVPGLSPEGFYTYTFDVSEPCQDAFSQVLVYYIPNNSPGTGGTVQVCAVGVPPVDLFAELGGTPLPGGTWTKPGGAAHNGTFIPGTDPCGNYTYTVPGVAPCGPSSAIINVQCVQPPNAGIDASLTVCANDSVENLNATLTAEPNSGIWISPDGFTIGGFNSNINIQLNGPGAYGYVVSSPTCPPETAFVNVDTVTCFVGVDEFAANVARFELAPNPASDQVTIELELTRAVSMFTLELVDVNGQVVRTEPLRSTGVITRRILSVADLPKGAYIVRLTSVDGQVVRKLMVR